MQSTITSSHYSDTNVSLAKAAAHLFAASSLALAQLLCATAWAQPSVAVPSASMTISGPASEAKDMKPAPNAGPAVKAAYQQALVQCEAELRADYASKIENAVATGKPHLVPVYERRRGEALVQLCSMRADIAQGEQKIAQLDQKIAANRQDIAVNRARTALALDAKRIAEKIISRTETPKDVADLQRAHQALKESNLANPDSGTAQVIFLIDGVLAKYKRLQ